MADADANPPPPAASPSPIATISPASGADAIEEQLAGLGLTVAGGGAGFEPSGWDDGPVPDDVAGGGVGAVVEEEFPVEKAPAAVSSPGADARVRFPRRPGEPDCSYYVKFGTCRFGTKCKFNHPARKKKPRVGRGLPVMAIFVFLGGEFDLPPVMASWGLVKGSGGSGSGSNSSSNKASSPDDDQVPREDYEGLAPDISDSSGFDDKGSASNSVQGGDDKGNTNTSENHRNTSYEIAAEPEKGSYFKKFDGTNVSKHKVPKGAKDKRKETVGEGNAQEECKYYATPGGCKFGKTCKYIHREGKEGKVEAEKVDLNFLGLPLRPGEKECPYYMRTGSCKYSTNCKFHHPDPSNVSSKEPVMEHENGDTPQQNVKDPLRQLFRYGLIREQ
ncbi:hypothetical protein EJB05_03155, partial [Eragrostis curvula]